MESLPNDLVFKILVKLPAKDIYKGAMLVHHNWSVPRAFVYTNLQRSTQGLLIQRTDQNCFCTFVAINKAESRYLSCVTSPWKQSSPVPQDVVGIGHEKYCLSTGKSLSMFVCLSEFSWDVWCCLLLLVTHPTRVCIVYNNVLTQEIFEY